MSSKTRNAEKRREHEEQMIAEEAERNRLEARSMWQKIYDLDAPYDLKEILWEITDG